jgi:hypothetical protein
MEKLNNLFDQEITRTVDAFPSIYSKHDVVSLLENLKINLIDELSKEKTTNAIITEERLVDFIGAVCRKLEYKLHHSELVDTSSAEFSIDYGNQISLDNIDVDTESIISDLDDILNDEFSTSFPEFLTNNNNE